MGIMDVTGSVCGSASEADLGGMLGWTVRSGRSVITALQRREEDSLLASGNGPHPAQANPAQVKTRALPLLIIAPACSLLLVAVLYLMLSPLIPERIAVHVGPDGVGYGSPLLMIAGACGIAAVAFAIGAATAKEFLRNNHWYQTQKSIAVIIMALGYGVIGVAVATIVSNLNVDPDAVSGNSVGGGLLGFLLMFTVAACTYVAVFPRAGLEPAGTS